MAVTITELAVKLQRLEDELIEARSELAQLKSAQPLTPEEWWAARLVQVRASNEKLQPLIDAAFDKMGITGEPVGAERVQELIAAGGVRPEENLFSRGIIEMREE